MIPASSVDHLNKKEEFSYTIFIEAAEKFKCHTEHLTRLVENPLQKKKQQKKKKNN